MKIYQDINLKDFHAWSGGKATLTYLIKHNLVDKAEDAIVDLFAREPISETELNDILWFEDEYLCECLGITLDELYS